MEDPETEAVEAMERWWILEGKTDKQLRIVIDLAKEALTLRNKDQLKCSKESTKQP